jgi:predicted nucleotidyltransferase
MSDSENPARIHIDLPMDEIEAFCRRWNITELALFGSVLREDFGPDSDIDVLVTFASEADLLADRERMRDELRAISKRPVDIVYRRVIEIDPNYLLRKSILKTAQVIYAA